MNIENIFIYQQDVPPDLWTYWQALSEPLRESILEASGNYEWDEDGEFDRDYFLENLADMQRIEQEQAVVWASLTALGLDEDFINRFKSACLYVDTFEAVWDTDFYTSLEDKAWLLYVLGYGNLYWLLTVRAKQPSHDPQTLYENIQLQLRTWNGALVVALIKQEAAKL